jgi:hypothetical protein
MAGILEHMVRSAVIFSDQNLNEKEEKNFHPTQKARISLSREEYRQLITDAYQEGREEALGEKPQTTLSQPEQKEFQKKGQEEALQENAKEEAENLQRFKTITQRHEIEMLRARTVFPFTLFPDTLVIDTTKVTFARKQLFATEYVVTIPLKDLSDVTIQTVLFLGSLIIKYMPQSNSPGMNQPVEIRIANLERKDAIKAKNVLKGALVAKAEEIDIAKLPPDEIVKVLEKFGQSQGVI